MAALVRGQRRVPDDLAYLDAIRRAAKRSAARSWRSANKEAPGARRSDTGELQIQRQMPIFTQGAPDYDVLIVADESDVFGPVPVPHLGSEAGWRHGRSSGHELASGA